MTDYRIDIGDRAIWVNDKFCCLGRFGMMGIDVHRALDKHGEYRDGLPGGSECLHCTHGATDLAAWATFRAEMLRHHGVTIPDDITPGWLRAKMQAA